METYCRANVPCQYEGLTRGLCGNWDGDRVNDMLGSDNKIHKDVVAMAHSWRSDQDDQCIEKGELVTKCEKAGNEDVYTACEKIEDVKGPFGVCLPKSPSKLVSVDPAGALHECIFDYCLEKTKEMLCAMYTTYANECTGALLKQNKYDHNKKPSVCNWETDPRYDCAPKCSDPNAEYRGCVDTCRDVRTCATKDMDAKKCPRASSLTSMCVCKDGFVLQDGKCIKATDCGCNVPGPNGAPTGVWVPNGYRFMTKNCQEVRECKANKYTVTKVTCNAQGEQCISDLDDEKQGFCQPPPPLVISTDVKCLTETDTSLVKAGF